MNRFSLLLRVALVSLTASFVASLRAASEAEAGVGRALARRYADAVVGVELVVTLKVKVGDREAPPREQRIEINGTVISSSGLTVTSLAEVDPQTLFDAMRVNAGSGRAPELVGTDFKEVKLRLADGKEVPARFVLKDGDLDLAFMAPDVPADGPKPEFPSFVKLEEAAEGNLLSSYYSIARAPKVLQRVPMIRSSEIIGIVEKPRRFYLMSDPWLGSPTVDAQGRILGITLENFASGRRTGYVVLPAADIAEIAKQATALQMQPKPAEEKAADAPPVPPTSAAPAAPASP